ncbi:MAG: SBBP repeat-containing protein [Planctomycetaceae bacterium]
MDAPLDVLLDSHGHLIIYDTAKPPNGSVPSSASLVVFDAGGTQLSATAVNPTYLDGAAFDLSGRLYKNEGFGVARYLFDTTNATWTRDSWEWTFPNGASAPTTVRDLASDPQGNIYLTGYTNQDFFAQPRIGGVDGFVVKLVPTN